MRCRSTCRVARSIAVLSCSRPNASAPRAKAWSAKCSRSVSPRPGSCNAGRAEVRSRPVPTELFARGADAAARGATLDSSCRWRPAGRYCATASLVARCIAVKPISKPSARGTGPSVMDFFPGRQGRTAISPRSPNTAKKNSVRLRSNHLAGAAQAPLGQVRRRLVQRRHQ